MFEFTPPEITLLDLINQAGLPGEPWIGSAPVNRVVADSRIVQPGDVFVAWQGGARDGHQFIPDAIQRGAIAVIGTKPLQDLPIPYVQVKNSQAAMAQLAAARYGFPGRKLTMVGVTGTDGKTTTANLIYQVLAHNGYRAGIISTVNAVIGDLVLDTGFHVTTPDAPDVQRYLAQMVQAGITHVVLETTSHGLAQHRVDACEFDIAVVTNITHEHLDYHGDYESYRASKGRLFEFLAETLEKPQGNPRLAVLNRDDESYPYLSTLAGENQATYGINAEALYRAENIENRPEGMSFVVSGPGFRIDMQTKLIGQFNIYNCLAAITACVNGLGMDLEDVREGVASLEGVTGRMERVHLGQDFTAMVDFAHTPNALRRALETAREFTSKRVITIFGSAGLRDREKRRLMAEIATSLADFSVFTAEDPRTESLDEILQTMAHAANQAGGEEGKSYIRIPDRGQAIQAAVDLAGPGDLVIVCGKGHEQSMCFGDIEYPWDDRVALKAALARRLGVNGPEMPYLPTQKSV